MAVRDAAVLGCAYLTADRGPLAAVSGGLPMAERTAAPSGGDAAGQDVLLATKLYVPRPPPGLVARPRLAEALADGRAGALVLVSAPASNAVLPKPAGWVAVPRCG